MCPSSNEHHALNVLQIVPELNSGGVERGTLEVAQELVRRGHRSLVISGGGRLVEQLEQSGSEHTTWAIGKKSLRTLRYVRPLRAFLQQQQIDLLHVRSRVPAWVAWLAWRKIAQRQRPRFVTTCHGLYSVNRYSKIMTRGERVIAISETVRDYILKNYPGTPPERIRLIPRGVDPDQFPYGYRPTDQWLASWRREYPQLVGKKVVVLPGRMTRLKGHPDFIELMRNLSARRDDVVGLIVGGVDPRRRAYAAEIRQKVVEYGLENVIFTGHRSDMREIYAVSDVAVSVSSHPPEAFGRTVLEALSIGVPVVGYDFSGPGEVLQRVFPQGPVAAGDLNALTDRVSEFLDRPPVVPRQHPYLLQTMLDKIIGVYQELVDEQREPVSTERKAA